MIAGSPRSSAAELRRAFDQAFAEPPAVATTPRVDLLAIVTGAERFLVRTRECAGIMRCPALTTLPSHNDALRGLARVQTRLVAVYSIAALLGLAARGGAARWLLLAAADPSVALSFDELAGLHRVAAEDVRGAAGDDTRGAVVHDSIALGVVLAVPSLLRTIGAPATPAPED